MRKRILLALAVGAALVIGTGAVASAREGSPIPDKVQPGQPKPTVPVVERDRGPDLRNLTEKQLNERLNPERDPRIKIKKNGDGTATITEELLTDELPK